MSLKCEHIVMLHLSLTQVKALKELAEQFLDKGPAWECMQMWEDPYTIKDLDILKDEIIKGCKDVIE